MKELKKKIDNEVAHLEEHLKTFKMKLSKSTNSKILADTIFKQITSNLNVEKIEMLSVVIREPRESFSRRVQNLLLHYLPIDFLHFKTVIKCEDATFAINDIALIEVDQVEDIVEDVVVDDDDFFE